MNFQELHELMLGLSRPAALTELAVLCGCLGLSWLLCSLLRRAFKVDPKSLIDHSVLFGRTVLDGVLFPVLALLLALAARHFLAGVVKVAVFKVAIPILLSLVVIRLVERVFSAAFPNSLWTRAAGRWLSWLAWIAAILWITGLLPSALAQMDDVRWKVGATQLTLRNLVEGSLTAAVVMMLVLWFSAAIERKIIRGTGDDLSTRKMVANLLRVVLMFIGLLVALSAVGIDLTALSVLGGAVGVGLGFGMQKIAANYVSGFIVLAEKMLRIGDMVKVDGFEGRITDIRTRYTVLRALNGRESIVPNEMMITQRVENASLMTVDTQVQIGFAILVAHGSDVRALQSRLAQVLTDHPRVLDAPLPQVLLTGFLPAGMELTIRYWLADPNNDQDRVKSELNLLLLDTLLAEKVQFNMPQRVLIEGEPSAPQR